MAIYEFEESTLRKLQQTTFATSGVLERQDLQRLLKQQIDVVAPDVLVVSEEFGEWADSRRRIDLLGVDKEANVVVIELKRTEDGGHMELQALRYAAMVSALTFEELEGIFNRYLASNDFEENAQQLLLDHLDWEEPNEDAFAQDVRIVLVSGEFSKEITTTVLWLNARGLDIRCVRLKPYKDRGRLLIDVQQIIPLPEAEEYQVRLRDKERREKSARSQSRDFTKFDVQLGEVYLPALAKRNAIHSVIKYLCDQGVTPEEIAQVLDWRTNLFRELDGTLSSIELEEALAAQLTAEGKKPQTRRYFIDDEQLIHSNGRTYVLSKMWGPRTNKALRQLTERFSADYRISFSESRPE